MSASAESLPKEFVVGSLNAMHDGGNSKLPPQAKRLDDIATVLGDRHPNAICVYELQGEGAAETLAEKLGMPKWAYTPNGKKGSGLMIAGGAEIEGFEKVPIDKETERVGMVAHYAGGLALAAEHPDHWPIKGRPMRVRQNGELLGALAGIEEVIIVGDFNDTPRSPSRRMFNDHGFVSVFETPPKTFPTNPHVADIGSGKLSRSFFRALFLMGLELSLDGGYTKGLAVKKAELITAIIKKHDQIKITGDHHGVGITTVKP